MKRKTSTAFGNVKSITVWTDLDLETLSSVEGVTEVRKALNNSYLIWIDPRYSKRDVLTEISRQAP